MSAGSNFHDQISFVGELIYQLVRVKVAILVPLSKLLVADEVDVWPGFGDEGV